MLSPLYVALPKDLQSFTDRSSARLVDVERLRMRCISNAVNARLFGVSTDDFRHVVSECWYPQADLASKSFTKGLFPKLFWRVDKDKSPQLRHPVLALKAFLDLSADIAKVGSLRTVVQKFVGLEGGSGWQLPEQLDTEELGIHGVSWRLPVRSLLPDSPEPNGATVERRRAEWRRHSEILGFP